MSAGSSRDLAISVRNLSKAYTIAHNRAGRPTTLAETVLQRLRNPFGGAGQEKETFTALDDVSFDVAKGDVVGVIGRNGAGKSTLLKILSKIAEPTRGEALMYGRVGSLLEVGTGFHPELTGRENIFLNGAILGMRRAEIRKHFDAIVDFAGVEKFLDTPVKRYSSGMYVRLAFAVAAHLDSEIMIVDEVLAVGDAEFQKKCLGKMKDVSTSGRTVLFVSHNMAAVSNLCTSALVMKRGRLDFYGSVEDAVDRYFAANTNPSSKPGEDPMDACRPSWAKPFVTAARVVDESGRETSAVPMGSDVIVELSFAPVGDRRVAQPVMGLVVNHQTQGTIGGVNMRMTGFEARTENTDGTGTLRCRIKRPPLLEGRYTIDLWLGDGAEDVDCLNGYLAFDVEPADIYNSGRLPFSYLGAIFLDPEWEFEPSLAAAR